MNKRHHYNTEDENRQESHKQRTNAIHARQDLQDQLDVTKGQKQPPQKTNKQTNKQKTVTIQQSQNNKQKTKAGMSPTATNQDRLAGQTKNKDPNTQHEQKQLESCLTNIAPKKKILWIAS